MEAAADISRQVSKDEFFKKVGPMDVHPRVVGAYPYTSIWELRSDRSTVGRSLGNGDGTFSYFLAA